MKTMNHTHRRSPVAQPSRRSRRAPVLTDEGDERPRGRGRRGEGRPRGFGPGFGPDFADFAGPHGHTGHGHGGHGRGRGGFGPGGPGDPGGPRGGRGGRGGRGPRRGRRGEVRLAILALLAEQPMNGYQVITEVAERSDGVWQPGPGSVYPALRLLLDEGLIAPDESDTSRRKVYALTDEGRAQVEERADELAQVWDQATRPHDDYREMRTEFATLGAAVEQVVATGTAQQFAAAQRALGEARRAIYAILAAPATDPGSTDPGSTDSDSTDPD